MPNQPEAPLDILWKEYAQSFDDFDDHTLARWLAQTLGQLKGKAWRFSHPLVGAYRLGAQLGHDRQIWLKRLASLPAPYTEASCCRAPMLLLITRDLRDSGLICQHCNETLMPFDEIPAPVRAELGTWAEEYAPAHAVAHWDDRQRHGAGDYDQALESAAQNAEQLLARMGNEIAPKLLEFFPAVIWEDQDECLEIRPEDVPL